MYQIKKFSRECRVICHKIKISANLFPIKDAILVWFTTAIKRLFKVVHAQKGFKSKKSAGITVAGNLVTDMGSQSVSQLVAYLSSYHEKAINALYELA